MKEESRIELITLATHIAELAVSKGAHDKPQEKKDSDWWLAMIERIYARLKLAVVDTDQPQ